MALIGLEASDISVSPGQNFLNPPPVPETPTDICTSGLRAVNSSATACVIGNTVEDPSINISPVKPDDPSEEGAAVV